MTFILQLPPHDRDSILEVQPFGQQRGGAEKDGEVRQIGGDGGCDAGKLDLDGYREICGGESGSVDLTDGGGGEGGAIEG